MSVLIQPHGEVGSGVTAHLQCPHCGHFSKSHAQQLSHIAASHPTYLDSVAFGRLGNILLYQSTAQLFHCSDCFFTSRDFTKVYKHIITKHCTDERGAAGGDDASEKGEEKTEEEEKEEDIVKRQRSKEEEKEGEVDVKSQKNSDKDEEKEKREDSGKRKRSSEEEDGEDGGKTKRSSVEEEPCGEDGGKRKRLSEEEERGEDDGKRKRLSAEKECVEDNGKRKRLSEEEERGEDDGKRKRLSAEEEGREDGGKRKKSSVEEEEGGEDSGKRKRSSEEDEKGGEDSEKRKRSSMGEEEVEGEGHDGECTSQVVVKTDGKRDESVLKFKCDSFCCVMCSWKSKLKGVAINHVVRKHDIPRAYAIQAIKRDAATEEEEATGLSGELLKVEMEVMAKVIRFISSRFVCQICGWKTKLKGLAITHVERSHEVERPYGCKDCQLTFFLPSRLQQHMASAHRPGRYACPFCCFRSHFLGGFKRHCSRCNAREGWGEGEEGKLGGGEGEDVEIEEEAEDEGEERKGEERPRRRMAKVIKEEEDDDD